jgi:hypothetical protein
MLPASTEKIITKKGQMLTFLYAHSIKDNGRIIKVLMMLAPTELITKKG